MLDVDTILLSTPTSRAGDPAALATAAQRHAVRAMPIADQMRLQLAFLAEGLTAAGAGAPEPLT